MLRYLIFLPSTGGVTQGVAVGVVVGDAEVGAVGVAVSDPVGHVVGVIKVVLVSVAPVVVIIGRCGE